VSGKIVCPKHGSGFDRSLFGFNKQGWRPFVWHFGCRHVRQIIDEYSRAPFVVDRPLILISIGKTYDDEGKSIYEAVRKAGRINPKKAEEFDLLLAHRRGIVVGAFKPDAWLPAKKDFPYLEEDTPAVTASSARRFPTANFSEVGFRMNIEHVARPIRFGS
jgi:hypothetical protein